MSGISIKVELQGEGENQLQQLLERMDNRLPLMASIGQRLADSARANFMNERGPDGEAWTPLKPATIRARQKRGKSQISILRETGGMIGSVNHRATNDEARIGSSHPLFAIHQLGGTIEKPASTRWMVGRRFAKRSEAPDGREVVIPAHKITIPARPSIGVSAADQTGIIEDAQEWLSL